MKDIIPGESICWWQFESIAFRTLPFPLVDFNNDSTGNIGKSDMVCVAWKPNTEKTNKPQIKPLSGKHPGSSFIPLFEGNVRFGSPSLTEVIPRLRFRGSLLKCFFLFWSWKSLNESLLAIAPSPPSNKWGIYSKPQGHSVCLSGEAEAKGEAVDSIQPSSPPPVYQ